MKKIFTVALALLMAACQTPDDTIQVGEVYQYHNGLFTVQQIRNDTVVMMLNQHTEYPIEWIETKENVHKYFSKTK